MSSSSHLSLCISNYTIWLLGLSITFVSLYFKYQPHLYIFFLVSQVSEIPMASCESLSLSLSAPMTICLLVYLVSFCVCVCFFGFLVHHFCIWGSGYFKSQCFFFIFFNFWFCLRDWGAWVSGICLLMLLNLWAVEVISKDSHAWLL